MRQSKLTTKSARRTYGSFATAWHVKRDFGIAGKKHMRSVSKGTFTSRRR